MQIHLIKKVEANADVNAFPTIPFNTGTTPSSTPTITPTSTVSVPSVIFDSPKNIFDAGENAEVDIYLDTIDKSINEYKLIFVYDPSHIRINDADTDSDGTQIEFLDTLFDLNDNYASNDGTISLQASLGSGESTVMENVLVAKINFTVLSRKKSEIEISETSNVISDSINILDSTKSETFLINSLDTEVPITTTTTPIVSSVPKTSLNFGDYSALLIIGFIFIIFGVLISIQVNRKSKLQ